MVASRGFGVEGGGYLSLGWEVIKEAFGLDALGSEIGTGYGRGRRIW